MTDIISMILTVWHEGVLSNVLECEPRQNVIVSGLSRVPHPLFTRESDSYWTAATGGKKDIW